MASRRRFPSSGSMTRTASGGSQAGGPKKRGRKIFQGTFSEWSIRRRRGIAYARVCWHVFTMSRDRWSAPSFRSPQILPRFVVDGRARCRRCGTAVGKGKIRIGFPMHDSRGEDGAVTGVFQQAKSRLCACHLRLSLRADAATALAPPLTLARAGWNHLSCSRISAAEWPGMDAVWASGW